MKFIYRNFKVTNNNGKGFWVSLRELNYMLEHGVVAVDVEKLQSYQNTEIPELSMIRMYDNYDMLEEMIYTPTDKDRKIYKEFYEAGRKVRAEMDKIADMPNDEIGIWARGKMR